MLDGSEEEDVFEEDVATPVLIPPTYRITVQIDYEEGEPVRVIYSEVLNVVNFKN